MSNRSHERWTVDEESKLIQAFRSGAAPDEMAVQFGRSELAIRARLAKLLLLPPLSEEQIRQLSPNTTEPVQPIAVSEASDTRSGLTSSLALDASAQKPSIDVQQAFRRFHFVYGLVNPQGQVYVGYSVDVWHRVAQHNRDLGAVATRGNGPWFPFAIYCFAAESDARAMETATRANFNEFAARSQASVREVLAQIGVPISSSQLKLL